mmetsp:Transcript_37552/g.95356  ORF Transcript_37552/g.95356 Transcript_37552/m.95356 type:complete len:251 (+) Transcript_37552:167-919(+)
MAPKVGPMRAAPLLSATSMPVRMMPGASSRVPSTTPSSAVFMSSAPMPSMLRLSWLRLSLSSRPSLARRLTTEAPRGPSWPVAPMTTLEEIVFGSMQDWVSWPKRVTVAQLVTTPATQRSPSWPWASCLTMRSSTDTALKSLMLSAWSTLLRTVAVKSAACLTTTCVEPCSVPSTVRSASSYGTPISSRNSSAGLRTTIGDMSCPPSHAPPPGETDCSTRATLTSGNLDSSYAHDRPAEPAPTMTTSHLA